MWEMCEHPQWIDILRNEAIPILREFGWTRQAFSKMELQDAFHKETQSYVRGSLTTVRRFTEDDIVFHDGFKIPKGRWFYLMPLIRIDKVGEFDPYKWVKRREATETPASLNFVASGLDSQTFGLGKSACPGCVFRPYSPSLLHGSTSPSPTRILLLVWSHPRKNLVSDLLLTDASSPMTNSNSPSSCSSSNTTGERRPRHPSPSSWRKRTSSSSRKASNYRCGLGRRRSMLNSQSCRRTIVGGKNSSCPISFWGLRSGRFCTYLECKPSECPNISAKPSQSST